MKDLSGKKFERLTAIERVGKAKHGGSLWKCLCDCGNEKFISTVDLIHSRVKSCGCLKKDRNIEKGYIILNSNESAEKRKKEYIDNTRLCLLQSKMLKNNTSGHKGVYYNSACKKWTAFIHFQKKFHHLGNFAEIKDAVKARLEAENKYFKPFIEKTTVN